MAHSKTTESKGKCYKNWGCLRKMFYSRLYNLMENHRIFKLEFYNLIFKENAVTYHETDQKSWFLLTERYMFSSL